MPDTTDPIANLAALLQSSANLSATQVAIANALLELAARVQALQQQVQPS